MTRDGRLTSFTVLGLVPVCRAVSRPVHGPSGTHSADNWGEEGVMGLEQRAPRRTGARAAARPATTVARR